MNVSIGMTDPAKPLQICAPGGEVADKTHAPPYAAAPVWS